MLRLATIPAVIALAVAGCAPTTSTGSLPLEVLVVLDSVDNTIRMFPVDSPSVMREIDLGTALGFSPRLIAARGGIAVIAGNQGDQARAALVDLAAATIDRIVELQGGTITAVAVPDDEHAYVADGGSGVVTRIALSGSGQQLIPAPGGPQGFGATRGKVFAVIGNRLGCGADCTGAPSWLVQVDPAFPRDSIPLSGPGNAGPSALGGDGLLYVLSRGDEFSGGAGRLSIVDPIRNSEVASFGGVGPLVPSWIIGDGSERVLLASGPGGLMVFNTRLRRFTLPFGSGIPLEFPTDLVGDAVGRIYVVQRGGCSSAAPGRVRVFASNLVERLSINAGACPVAATIAEVPADRFFATP